MSSPANRAGACSALCSIAQHSTVSVEISETKYTADTSGKAKATFSGKVAVQASSRSQRWASLRLPRHSSVSCNLKPRPTPPCMASKGSGGSASDTELREGLSPEVLVEELDHASPTGRPDQTAAPAPDRLAAAGASTQTDSSSEESESDVASLLGSLHLSPGEAEAKVQDPVLSSFDLKGIASYIKSGKAKKIICMCGAGLSVSAGIPDFRTPGTGLYSNLQKFDLPFPEAVFEINYFKRKPAAFFMLAKELFPGTFVPTPAHFFLKLLHDKGLLLRCFTQNIDSLENQAGLPKDAVVAAHGNFDKGLVKPDIVFFGESLPQRFFQNLKLDFPEADLLIVLGTSLTVQPFASLIDKVKGDVPRVLINRERVGEGTPDLQRLGVGFGFNFGKGTFRDVLYLGDCDAGARELCELLGWTAELDSLIADAHKKELEAHNPMNPSASSSSL